MAILKDPKSVTLGSATEKADRLACEKEERKLQYKANEQKKMEKEKKRQQLLSQDKVASHLI
jgi:hypothetical protein